MTVINGKNTTKCILLFNKKNLYNECFPILSQWIKSWRLYNGYSTAGRQQSIFNKKINNFLFINSKLYLKDMKLK